MGVGAPIARTLNSYGTRAGPPPVSEIRFSDCREPLDLPIISLVHFSPWLWRQLDRGLSTMMAILPFASDCVWEPINTTRGAGRAVIAV